VPIFRYLKRKWLLSKPFPAEWEKIIQKKVPVFYNLPAELHHNFRQRIVILLNEKHFEGCGGLEMTDEIRVVVAAYASVLILMEPSDYYGDLQAILVYPDDYMAHVNEEYEGGIVSVGYEPRSGEYWGAGNIVLSWGDIKRDIYESKDGHNLIYHEFSHLLDDRYGLTAGISMDGEVLRDDEWSRILAKTYRRLVRESRTGRSSVLDPYGAKNPAELFSVATEAFFEKPGKLKYTMPGLYSILHSFYRVDPASWKE
jgi:MtfA peptidase